MYDINKDSSCQLLGMSTKCGGNVTQVPWEGAEREWEEVKVLPQLHGSSEAPSKESEVYSFILIGKVHNCKKALL